jgi:hypothetical protein
MLWFTPRLHAGDIVDGVFIVDSFGYALDDSGGRVYYLPDVLQFVYWTTGILAGAVCQPGACIRDIPRMLRYCRGYHSQQFVVLILMGNDIMGDHFADSELHDAMAILPGAVRAVFGGSSGIWGFCHSMLPAFIKAYDAKTRSVVQYCMGRNLSCITGAHLLQGIVIGDSSGHVSTHSLRQIAIFFVVLAKWATPGRARL